VGGIVGDVFADSLQAFVVADDVFVVVALPETAAEEGQPRGSTPLMYRTVVIDLNPPITSPG
jgi:hypothetical protein